jgi:hypothetical protein
MNKKEKEKHIKAIQDILASDEFKFTIQQRDELNEIINAINDAKTKFDWIEITIELAKIIGVAAEIYMKSNK